MSGAEEGQLPPEIVDEPPAEASREAAARLSRVESRNVTFRSDDFPIAWTRARGSNVWDADGNRYVDLTAAFGVASVGHGHPRVVEALRDQAGRLVHGMGDVHPPAPKVELLERLCSLSPWPEARAILGCSGSDAVEAALKTARLATGEPGVLAFTGAYHGLGYGALAVTDGSRFRAPFRDQLNPHAVRAGFPHPYRPPSRPGFPDPPADPDAVAAAALEDVRRALDTAAGRRVGAVLVEPVQGRGGEVVPPPGFLASLADVCRDRDLLLVADEIYTGFGRTGRRFACEEEGVRPDLMCVGKSFGGGMPISACLGPPEVMDAWPPSEGEAIHTSTFLGHPLACAGALATLELLEEEDLARRARGLGRRWRGDLESMATAHPSVGEVRGRGLTVGLDLIRDRVTRRPDGATARRVVRSALRRGWIVLAGGPDGNVISLSPPLTVSEELLEGAVGMLDAALDEAESAAREG